MPNSILSITQLVDSACITATTTMTRSQADYDVDITTRIVHNPVSTWVNPYQFVPINRMDSVNHRPYRGYDRYAEWDTLMRRASVLDTMGQVAEIASRNSVETAKSYFGKRFHDLLDNLDDVREHCWHRQLQVRFKLHPAIKDAVDLAPPVDRDQLILEWAHVSESDPNRLAYTRDDRAGHDDRQTVTTIGKYLRRHFLALTDNQIRDISMRHGAFKMEMWDTTERIVFSVQNGPSSCMQWDDGDGDWDSTDGKHPYEAYAPEFGWRAAVRLDGDRRIVGRCLVNETAKIYVRSYARKEDGYSHSDEALEVWLRDQGYTKAGSWRGCKLKRIVVANRWGDDVLLAPYLDGHPKAVDDHGAHLLVVDGGRFWFENTDGTATEQDLRDCACCGNSFAEDDMSSIGYHGDETVCQSCIEDNFNYVYGRRGNQYWLHSDHAVFCEINDNWYDSEYLADNYMVELHDGDICPSDRAVYLESRDEYWYHEADCVVYCEHEGVYEHIDDCVELHDGTWANENNVWCCSISGDYYHNDHDNECVEFCDIETQMHHTAHEDAVDESYSVDLDDVTDAIADMTV